MRFITIGLFAMSFAIQGCGSAGDTLASNNAVETTNDVDLANAQSKSGDQTSTDSAESSAQPCGTGTLRSCLDPGGPSPTPTPAPTPAAPSN